jgi:hypothetical protein
VLLDRVLEAGRRVTKLPHHRELNGRHAEIFIPGIGSFKTEEKEGKEGKEIYTKRGSMAQLSKGNRKTQERGEEHTWQHPT